MKVIDLLVDIANNGVSKEIKHFKYFHRINEEYDIAMINLSNIFYKLNNEIIVLNDEVEIIKDTPKEEILKDLVETDIDYNLIREDKKIEKLKKEKIYVNDPSDSLGIDKIIYRYNNEELGDKINEIIDYLKSKGE